MLRKLFSPRPRYLVSKIILNGCAVTTNEIIPCRTHNKANIVLQNEANRFKNIGGNSYVNSIAEETNKVTIKSSPFIFIGEIKKL